MVTDFIPSRTSGSESGGPVDAFYLPSAGRAIPWQDALAAVLGYARSTRRLVLGRRGTQPAQTVEVPAFAYRAYDCVRPSTETGFSWLDVLVVDSLNGKLSHPIITALQHAGNRAWLHVDRAIALADGRAFWDLPADEVGRHPTPGSTGDALNRAWEECMRTEDVKVALTHKLLHHKRPDLFPLIDRKTEPLLAAHTDESAGLWAVVHSELNANQRQFTALETTFAELVDGEGDVPLTRLRLHDVLLWLIATGYWDRAVTAGHSSQEWRRYAAL